MSIDESIIYKVPTIQKLRALFDNYELDASDSEIVTPNELQENDDFINAVLDTQVMQTAMKFLNKKGFYIRFYFYVSHFPLSNIILATVFLI